MVTCCSGLLRKLKMRWIVLCNTLFIVLVIKKKVNIDDASHIVAVTRNNFYKLPYKDGKNKYRYVVTALDRLHNESKSVSKKVKL